MNLRPFAKAKSDVGVVVARPIDQLSNDELLEIVNTAPTLRHEQTPRARAAWDEIVRRTHSN